MNKYNKLAKNSIIFAVGNFGSRFINILMLPFYTSEFTKSDFGQIELITVTLALLIPIFTVSIVEAVIRFSLEKKYNSYFQVISNSLLFIVLGTLLLICFYPLLESIVYIKPYLHFFYILFIIQSLHSSVKQFTRVINLNKTFMLSDMIYTFVFATLNIMFILIFNLGIEGYFLSMILAYTIDLMFLSFKSKVIRYIGFIYLDKDLVRSMFFYCLPLIPNTIMWWFINISDRYLLAYYLGLSANGIYAIANKFPSLVSNISSIFFNAWQVSAIEESESEEKDGFYSNVFNIFFFVMVITASIYIMFNKYIISMLVSNEFYDAWKYAPILVLAALFSSFSSFIGTNYVAMKKTKGAFYTSCAGAVTNILLNIILIPSIGIYGAAIATMISFLIMWIYRIIDTKRFVKIKYPFIRIVLSFIFLGIQIIIGYIHFNMLSWFLNLIILGLIIILSTKYTKYPFLLMYKKMRKKIFQH